MSIKSELPGLSRLVESVAPTPLQAVQLAPGHPQIWCKLEYLNPSGSTKDRIAAYILSKAWREGTLQTGSLVCEASSGSTSIAMAMVCAQMGLRFVAVMPEGVSNERVKMIRAYGGNVRLCPAESGMDGCIALTEEIARNEGAYLPRQFDNHDNAEAHRLGTAHEILAEIPGRSAGAVVSGVGTGGLWSVCTGDFTIQAARRFRFWHDPYASARRPAIQMAAFARPNAVVSAPVSPGLWTTSREFCARQIWMG